MEQERRDWKSYARRVDAFGSPGDIDLTASRITPEKIPAFHKEAEKLEAEKQSYEEQPQRFRMR
jgi:hypothetical protein